MEIEIDDKSGFCFGVVNAIGLAERSLAENTCVAALGDIVHNRLEMERLEGLGLSTITHAQLAGLHDGAAVLIRAHGEPPSTYAIARQHDLRIIDATCPVVAALQREVAQAHRRMTDEGGRVVILGKKGHAEVVGLTGQAAGGAPVVVVENAEDLAVIDFARPIYFLSQTTQDLALFAQMSDEIMRRAERSETVTVRDTICRRVANREPHLRAFAARHDVVVFVSGRKSSNGRVLYEVCLSANPRSYMVEDESELPAQWFAGARTVGVCGATSTPRWLMERVARACVLLATAKISD
ncbi:MAG: 4-hydroxy-3-methylbut-2-enyl diphosphate reductase [Rikenellaceae bacterium]|nr:4-hydroxy-3-methylbut-2-enyl diphosphate reductase [Rikenellaceae bacterium]MCL2692940.1 4-hydroxy-3-methylbut-2-enyl diphosphate reductase [Rikenellaceae bacterium]